MESALHAYLKDLECQASIAPNKHETDAAHLSLQLKGEHGGGRSRKERNKDEKKTNIEEKREHKGRRKGLRKLR